MLKFTHLLAGTVAALAVGASPARAQTTAQDSVLRLDVTVARHEMSGGLIDYRTGGMLDALLALGVHDQPRWETVVAIGGGGVAGGFGDRCLIRPDGGCAPQANFGFLNLLIGGDVSLGGAALRGLAGPAYYTGGGAHSFGAEVRMDLSSPTVAHVGLGPMVRATWLPSHGAQRFVAWAVGASVVFR
jgi:hypothetical protein